MPRRPRRYCAATVRESERRGPAMSGDSVDRVGWRDVFAADFQWGLERFLDEARTLARFQHPNIIRVLHFFEAQLKG